MFSSLAHWISKHAGHSIAFMLALAFIVIWLITGPFFGYSDTWQLIINTSTTIITFLMVFLLQHTQNRDTIAIQLKLDEIIRAMGGAHNEMLKIEELSEVELQNLCKRYERLAAQIKIKIKSGECDTDIVDLCDEPDKPMK